ncbi:MAG: glycosyltransferase [Elusimicrobia bacterium]|nr:glycosyltransferase [Elusimicrobiota bacterium]
MEGIWWFSAGMIVYFYCGYPILLFILSLLKPFRSSSNKDYQPSMTLIIAAYNEEDAIEKKVQQSLALEYPKDLLQIIVASDASTDRTDEIVKQYESRGVVLFRQSVRLGKSAALNAVVSSLATGEILVFTDATTEIQQDSLIAIAGYFHDQRTGAVCGNLRFIDHVSHGESMYWRYEKLLRKYEGKIGFLPFVSGAFYAIQKKIYSSTPGEIPDDSNSPLQALKIKKYVVFAENAVATEISPRFEEDLFSVKVRGIVRELNSIRYNRVLLNPFEYFFPSLILFNHRILRYSIPFLLLLLFVSNVFLISMHSIYMMMFMLQLIFYVLAITKSLFLKKSTIRIFLVPYHFCLINYAAAIGVAQFILQKKYTVWEPAR